MNRKKRAEMAQQTVQIVQQGLYETPSGKRVHLAQKIAESIEGTRLLSPDDLTRLQQNHGTESHATQIEVENQTTLAAAERIVAREDVQGVLCLNFASAKNPGGGYLGGSQAQEESLARSSALVATQESQWEYYETNRNCGTSLYTDHMILSPNVLVFRNDDGMLLEEPYQVSMVTAPAVNAGAVRHNEPNLIDQISEVMADRIDKLLSLAAAFRYQHLILGAWGCGVFRNDPTEIAQLFANTLLGSGRFAAQFATVTFAVFDKTEQQDIVSPFRKLLTT